MVLGTTDQSVCPGLQIWNLALHLQIVYPNCGLQRMNLCWSVLLNSSSLCHNSMQGRMKALCASHDCPHESHSSNLNTIKELLERLGAKLFTKCNLHKPALFSLCNTLQGTVKLWPNYKLLNRNTGKSNTV